MAMTGTYPIIVLAVGEMRYDDQVTAASLQGLANRTQPAMFLDYGIYDDPASRKTNEDFISEELWREKFRDALGQQDQHNLDAYAKIYPLQPQRVDSLAEAIAHFLPIIKGFVVWDPEQPDSINVAIMICSLESLLPISPDHVDWAERFGLPIQQDLRGRWQDRIALYSWALENLFSRCTPGKVASIEPGWHRPEFIDYVVKERIFTCGLSSKGSGQAFNSGWKLLLLCLGGPSWLRNIIYGTGLFRRLKQLAVERMSADPEVGLTIAIQKRVAQQPGAVIFGWHTNRDDEFSFMVLLSANGLRLAPAHLAANFSFHSALPASVPLKQFHIHESAVVLEPEKTYLTFTYSDGDQLMLMNTAQVGGWRRPERGLVPFNWEMQPLLAELAPALLGLYYSSLTPNDCLVAGPSGAGYIIPPLHDDLPDYLLRSAQACAKADINVITSYYPDPPDKVIRQHLQAPSNILGFLSGYFFVKARPVRCGYGKVFLCNAWPHLSQVRDTSEEVLAGVKALLDAPSQTPRFIGVHLFAYRTTIADVYNFVQTLDPARVKVVRADEFLLLAKQHYGGRQQPQ
ncbi:MAG TPA: GxGYxYP family putative glycoside hydrolase [Anaerolineae bacterium]|nr:GxGYxYP family putative glycoside hydrolase [Anaerolineae bacterium]HPL28490.1 GxGYxYP family putative glycoside hydrolase [Anaerolineae bacterium]